jgi:hypothetical protein
MRRAQAFRRDRDCFVERSGRAIDERRGLRNVRVV